jgi:lysophospholipase L1-like esterase
MNTQTICFAGDEILGGIGDSRALGWVGRVMSRTEYDDSENLANTIHYTLPMLGENTTSLSKRITSEVLPRFEKAAESSKKHLVVSIGIHDIGKITQTRTRLNIVNLLEEAQRHGISPMVVGPAPLDPEMYKEIHELSESMKDVTTRRGIPYIDLWTPLHNHNQWMTDLKRNSHKFPSQVGYGLIAWIVLHENWNRWLLS